jgi:trans-aconitate methyltransferase
MATPAQTWDPHTYAHNAGFVPELGAGVVQLLAAQPGERVLDLGCGDGKLTVQLQAAGCKVLGVDASVELVQAARDRGAQALVVNGEALSFEREFEAVFSNAALHWMRDADAVLSGVWRALVPGGRFVAELGGYGCVAKIRAALSQALARRGIDASARDPWYFPSADDYAARLERAGFRVRSIELFDRPTPLPTGVEGWLATFAHTQLAGLDAQQTSQVLREVRDLLEPQLSGPQGWFADYVRLRFAADKPA